MCSSTNSVTTSSGPSTSCSSSFPSPTILTVLILSDDNFKTLNSLLNKEVAEYEAKEGIRNGAEQLPEWNPEHDAEAAEVDVGRTLSELDLGPAKRREVLKFGLEEEIDARRERMRRAAEERRRREEGTGA